MKTALCLLAAAILALSGCGDHHDHPDHEHHDHEESPTGATFKEGVGLFFPEETHRALGLATVEVGHRVLTVTVPLVAQVFQPGPPTLATASVPIDRAEFFAGKSVTGAHIVRVDRAASAATGEADLILELTAPHARGEFVSLELTAETPSAVTVIPRSALLRTTEGTFVYVLNGAAFLRTPVVVGQTSAGEVEITDGLYAGDIVVSRPVEQLWLTELRFTKGGGHSH